MHFDFVEIKDKLLDLLLVLLLQLLVIQNDILDIFSTICLVLIVYQGLLPLAAKCTVGSSSPRRMASGDRDSTAVAST